MCMPLTAVSDFSTKSIETFFGKTVCNKIMLWNILASSFVHIPQHIEFESFVKDG